MSIDYLTLYCGIGSSLSLLQTNVCLNYYFLFVYDVRHFRCLQINKRPLYMQKRRTEIISRVSINLSGFFSDSSLLSLKVLIFLNFVIPFYSLNFLQISWILRVGFNECLLLSRKMHCDVRSFFVRLQQWRMYRFFRFSLLILTDFHNGAAKCSWK